jgi:predicted extracellular nuclease
MKKKSQIYFGILVILVLTMVIAGSSMAAGPPVFINEIHYDNSSTDTGEAIEIAGPAGTNLAGWSIVLYNGNGGAAYNTIALGGTIPNQQAGFGTLSFAISGIQNGSPDGLALVDPGSAVIEFLSYEGSFGAVGGPANGMTSTDIGVSEPSATPLGNSLQLGGAGTMGGDFAWAASQANTFGAVNTGQTFGIVTGPTDPVINEFVANHTGADSQAFVEIFGDPSAGYSAFTVLEIEGDSSSSGQQGKIDAVLPVGTTNAGGYWTDDEDMENGTITILLVEGFTGSSGQDLDTNNDGTFDVTPWSRIVDDVAVEDTSGTNFTYSATVLAPGFDGGTFTVGGASRIPNSADTDTTADWLRNDFDGFGFPGFPGSPALGEAENTPDAVNVAITVPTDPVGVCGDPSTLIHDIQGAGLVSPDVGSIREIEGVVVGDFQGSTGLNGFMVQEEDGDVDANPLTSEGIFVFDPANAVALNPGDVVRIRGSVAEFFTLTEINNVVTVIDCNSTDTASPSTVTLPVTSVNDFEPTEGMAVTFPQTLFASGNFNQGRFGEVDLSVGGAQDNPTNVVAPGAAANALQDLNNRSRIQLDDGSNVQNPLPLPPYIGAGGTLRTGDSVAGLTAVMSYAFGLYELHPTTAVNFTRVNVRPGVPNVGGTIQVAAYNVLNYFTTIDNAGPICGPLGNQGCRGADTPAEFIRQRDKLVTAISTLDADVVGLMEIENHPGDVPTADLVAGLNDATAPGTYDYVATGAIGSDAIRVALLYQPASVTPFGAFEVLDSSDDPMFDDTRNRPMLVQSFVENVTGEVFTVGVNHLKSKGSNCNAAGDPDTGDGQGNCNVTRTSAAQAIVDFLATDPTGSGDSDYLVIGDLNAYAQEDPVVTIEAGGYTDLIEAFVGAGYGAGAYSFNFFSQSGYLDHGLASETMTPQVTGADFWPVNADEPRALDYNNFNQPLLYNPDQFRSSDHDPVVIGLFPAKMLKETASLDLSLLLPTGDKNTDKRINKAIEEIEASLNSRWWTSDQTITSKKVFDRERNAIAQLELIVASGVPEASAAQAAIDVLVNADRQLAQIELIAAIARGGSASKIADAEAAMADAETFIALGLYVDAVNAYAAAWDAATKA